MRHHRTALTRQRTSRLLAAALLATAAAAIAVGPVSPASAGTAAAASPSRGLDAHDADFDGDGRSDLVIGAPNYPTDHLAGAGSVEVVYDNGAKQTLTADDARNAAGGAATAHAGDHFGSAFAVGHFTGTRYTDLVVTTFSDSGGVGSGLTVFQGGPRGLVTPGLFIPQAVIDPSLGTAFGGFGFYATAGDFNGDGITDLAVAAHHLTIDGHADSGAIFVIPGSTKGLQTSDVTRFDLQRTTAFGRPPLGNEFFGYAMAAGDFNGDGIDDLAVFDAETVDGQPQAGRIHLLYGSTRGLTPSTVALDEGSAAQAYSFFGLTLATADTDGDGTQDLVVGSPNATVDGLANAGTVTVFRGFGGIGLRPSVRTTFNQGTAGLGTAPGAGNQFGLGLAVGRFAGGRYDDIAVSVEGQTVHGKTNAGAIEVLDGSYAGLTARGSQLVTDAQPVAGSYFGGGLAVLRGQDGVDQLAVSSPLATAGGVAGSGTVQLLPTSAGRVLSAPAARYTLRGFPSTTNQTDAGLGAYVVVASGEAPTPTVNTMAG